MADQSLAFLTKMGLAAAPVGQPIGLPSAPPAVDPAAPPVGLGKTEVTFAPPAPIATSPIPAVAQASAAPWMPPAAAQAAPVAPAPAPAPFVPPAAATQGYGSQINPPESVLAAPVVLAAPATGVAPSTVVGAATLSPEAVAALEPAAPVKKGPGRPKKDKGVDGAVVTSAAGGSEHHDTPVDVPIPVVFYEQFSFHDRALLAVLPAAFEACKAAIFSGAAAPDSALELARAVVAPLAEAK